MIPIVRSRIIGDRQTGKTGNCSRYQSKQKMLFVCWYWSKKAQQLSVVNVLEEKGAMPYAIVVASANDPATLQYAFHAGRIFAEYLMYKEKQHIIL
jgi:F0F1-type ATP synthase alpha subunit